MAYILSFSSELFFFFLSTRPKMKGKGKMHLYLISEFGNPHLDFQLMGFSVLDPFLVKAEYLVEISQKRKVCWRVISHFSVLYFLFWQCHIHACVFLSLKVQNSVSKSSCGFKRIEGRIEIFKISVRIGTYFLKQSQNVDTLAASK